MTVSVLGWNEQQTCSTADTKFVLVQSNNTDQFFLIFGPTERPHSEICNEHLRQLGPEHRILGGGFAFFVSSTRTIKLCSRKSLSLHTFLSDEHLHIILNCTFDGLHFSLSRSILKEVPDPPFSADSQDSKSV